MVLTSQSIRSDGRRMMSSDGRRIRRRGWKLFALLGLVIVFTWIGWRFFGTQSEIPANEIRAVDPADQVSMPPAHPLEEIPVATIEASNDVSVVTPQAITTSSDPVNAPQETASMNDALQAVMAQVDTDPVNARSALTRILEDSATPPENRLRAYEAINKVNAVLTFSDRVLPNDPCAQNYTVKEGDSLSSIRKSLNLDCEWRFIQRINRLPTERSIRVGQVLKTPTSVFHAEVRKGEFRLNIFEGDGSKRVMVASYPISLGEFNSTPTGSFAIRPRSKLIDPEWRNPRTGQHFESNDPANPIGERWMGLKGIEPHNKDFAGYGIHGTIDTTSIGKQASMGCIRMMPQDVEVVYELLTEPNSIVTISP